MASTIPFVKMQGIGNDFVLIDLITESHELPDLASLARQVNDRRRGVGGDGLILVERGDSAPFRMRMFNPDGSESEMCGNGIRCFARLLADRGLLDGPVAEVETGAGLLQVRLLDDGQVTVDMGLAGLTREAVGMIPGELDPFIKGSVDEFVGTAVSMGNPHLVIFVPDVTAIRLADVGPRLEVSPLFPNRVNVHFAEVVSPTQLIQRTWERGAGITLACGTGACACAVAAFETGRTGRRVNVDLPGGRLQIEYRKDSHVLMTGAADFVFEGEVEVNGE